MNFYSLNKWRIVLIIRHWSRERRNSGSAVSLNSQVVRVHLYSEESSFSPVSAPGVSGNPVLSLRLGIKTISHYGYFVINNRESLLFRVYASSISLELISHINSAWYWPIGINLSLHLISTTQSVVWTDIVMFEVLNSPAVSLAIISSSWSRTYTVFAQVDSLAVTSKDIVVSTVLHARWVWNTIVLSISINSNGVTSIARATSLTVNYGLRT